MLYGTVWYLSKNVESTSFKFSLILFNIFILDEPMRLHLSSEKLEKISTPANLPG